MLVRLEIKEGLLPIDSPPVSLVSWYSPEGRMIVSIGSWVAVIEGNPPELRTGGGGMLAGGIFQEGSDFVVSLLDEAQLPLFAQLVRHAERCGEPVTVEDDPLLTPASMVQAPLLGGAALHFECAGGRVTVGPWTQELSGQVRRLQHCQLNCSSGQFAEFKAFKSLHLEESD